MKWSESRDQFNLELKRIDSIPDYRRVYLSTIIVESINQLNKKYIEHLLNDLVNDQDALDVRLFLNDKEKYKNTNEYALECLEKAFFKTNIHGAKIKDWTISALNCFDILLIKFINDYKNDKIKKKGKWLKETDVYDYLVNKKGNEYEIGIAFQNIYQLRSSFFHVQYELKDGIRNTKKLSYNYLNDARDIILEQFEKGLNALIKEMKQYDF